MEETKPIETAAQKAARRRRAAAERARRYRERKKSGSTPLPRDCDAAWTEASSFWLRKHSAALRAQGVTAAEVVMPIASCLKVARAILERQGFDRRQSAIAMTARIDARPEHEDPTWVPSIAPESTSNPVRTPKHGGQWGAWDDLLDDLLSA